MAQRPQSLFVRYGSAVLIVAIASLFRFGLNPVLEGAGFAVFFFAVVIAAWFGGLGPSLVALTLSVVASAIFFPRGPEQPDAPIRVLIGLGAFYFVGVVTAVLSESMRAAQRRAEAETEIAIAQREQLRATLACIGDAVIVTDNHGRLTMMNQVAESLTGWRMAEASGQPLETVFQICDEQTRQRAENSVDRALRVGGVVSLANPTLLFAKDGSDRPVNDSAAPIRDANGNISGAVLIFRDVTQARRAELSLRDADRRKDEFLAILAHELRNPLAPICTALDILRSPQADANAAGLATGIVERQVHCLVRLVDDLLDVSRIMCGKIELRPEQVDLHSVVVRAVETAQPVIEAQGHKLTVSLPPDPIRFTTDPIRLAQVINNLLTNAAKYTESGGSIWLTGEQTDKEIIIRVRDSGIGIPTHMLPEVFRLFTQVDSSLTRSQGGLGIGLTLVKSLVELNGGSVEAHSGGPGHGSEFVVRLPVSSRPMPAVLQSQNTERKSSPVRYRILVVDDNRDAAETLTTLLRFNGHEVQVAHDGPAALEWTQHHNPNIVFLDIGMPDMDGLEVARRTRQFSDVDSPVLVAVTGWGSAEDRRRTQEAGFDYHLVKPVTNEVLNQLLSKVFRSAV